MATLESTNFTLFHHHHPRSSNSNNNFYSFSASAKPPLTILNPRVPPRVSTSVPSRTTLSSNPISYTAIRRRHGFQLLFFASHLQEAAPTITAPDHTTPNVKKLYISNLPWSLSPAEIINHFSQCGTVTDVEIIKNKEGGTTGFAFVTMASAFEAQAAILKFHSHEISGRTIKVELSKRYKKPRPPPVPPAADETRYKIYVSNLDWEVRSGHLGEFITENFKKPLSARVVLSAGYGFVSFATKEEAEEAISALDGKELMGRPVCLTFSRKTVAEASSNKDEEQGYADQS